MEIRGISVEYAWGALRNYEWNGIFYCSAPSQQDPEQVDPD